MKPEIPDEVLAAIEGIEALGFIVCQLSRKAIFDVYTPKGVFIGYARLDVPDGVQHLLNRCITLQGGADVF